MRESFSELLWAVMAEGEKTELEHQGTKVFWLKINQNYIKIWNLKGVLDATNSQTHLLIIQYSIYSNIKLFNYQEYQEGLVLYICIHKYIMHVYLNQKKA